MTFGKSFFASFLAFFAAIFVLGVVFVFMIVGIVASSSNNQVVVRKNSVLHLKLDAQITELEVKNPLDALTGSDVPKIGLLELKEAIRHAETDDNIKGIYLDVSHPMAGFSTIEEIRQSLLHFRESGKWVVAYNETMSEGAYYLASAADKVYLYPEGEVEFNGLSIEIAFYKRLFDKLEIKPQVFRVGKFKSAVEPFFLEQMSDENRTQLTELSNSLNDVMLTKIAEARKIDKAQLKKISDGMLVRNAAQAKEYGLVDDLFYSDQFLEELKTRLDTDAKKVNLVTYTKYKKSFMSTSTSENKIAVIVADGTIMPGKSDGKQLLIGGETFVEQIRKAREDDDVKAIVMRVNSPGGEFRASDMIWREVQLASQVKPVIASMSDYAASGGYYIAMAADTIVAQPHTITGSIGIFGVMFDMSGFLSDKIGVTFDEVKTGEFGEMYTVTRPLTDAEKNFWQRSLDAHYETFTSKAADGRGVTQDSIKAVASGRVWTGEQALQHKLVDVLGGFDDAVQIAADRAGVSDYKVRFYPEQELSPLEEIITAIGEDQEDAAVRAKLGAYYTWYLQFQKVKTYQGAQARMPFEIQIH
ncbi:signal peptide peptidase SppA [Pseudochryseolinea flava]|uniref:Signal peptide peptidase SppA n=1 Tax=Pseudochryseolinea flava TaxID=2059302 RepID=A0A364Y479_9BACT|nr:signal peptide peptidase SppA [Pseudochryseolinea flava]RAW01667.1 signal peptide peptidase SppA [Pseudochryseolinea flava]